MEITIIFFKLVYSVTLFISTVIIHEIGHYIANRLVGFKDVEFKFKKMFGFLVLPASVNKKFEYDELFKIKNIKIKLIITSLGGIILGFIPMIIYYLVTLDYFDVISFLLLYILMCSSDIKHLIEYSRGQLIPSNAIIRFSPENLKECQSLECEVCNFYGSKCSGNRELFK